jgi:hypothetical protein
LPPRPKLSLIRRPTSKSKPLRRRLLRRNPRLSLKRKPPRLPPKPLKRRKSLKLRPRSKPSRLLPPKLRPMQNLKFSLRRKRKNRKNLVSLRR